MTVTDDYALPGEETPPANPSQQDTGSGLRAQLEAANAEKRQMAERLAKLETQQRTNELTSLVKGAGLPEAAAGRYPADAEVTPEKVNAWAEAEKAYAQQLTGTQPAPPTATQPGVPTPPVGVTPEAQRAAALVQTAAAGAQPPTEGLEGMLARLQDKSVSYPQLQAEMRAMGFRDQ